MLLSLPMKEASAGKTAEQPTMTLWDRTMVWLHRYLALNVQPRTRSAPPPEESSITVETAPLPSTTSKVGRGESRAPAQLRWAASSAAAAGTIPTFAIGERPAEGLTIKRILNANDFATTYVAHHEHWNIDLLVKVPSRHIATIAGALRQVATRGEQWMAIGLHPHIASCYYVQWLQGVPLRITEYVEGTNLREWMRADRANDLRAALALAIQICRGLEQAHGRGIGHGYLTPENVLLTLQGSPKLTDFGQRLTPMTAPVAATGAIEADDQTRVALSRLMQIADYVAPERWSNALAVDAQADIFSLGVCLYEVFAGCLPYGTTGGRRQDAVDPASHRDLPESLAALLRRCVDWPAESRISSVAQVRLGLSEVYETRFGAPESHATRSVVADEWNNKAVSYFYLGQDTEADAAWGYALEADAGHLDALFNRSLARWRRGAMSDEAVIQEIEGVPVDRDNRWKARYLLALVHEERGDIDNAIATLEQAERDQPGIPEVHTALDRTQHGPLRATVGRRVLEDHEDYVSTVGVTADGQIGLSASHDHRAALWQLQTGVRLQVFEAHEAPLSCAYLSPDGRWALTGSDDHTMRLWDIATGECQRVFEGHAGRVAAACLSPDGRILLWSGNFVSHQVEGMTVQLWDAQSGERLHSLEGHTSAVKTVCLSADGRWALTGSDDQTVRLWEVASGACRQVFEGHRNFVSGVCFSDDAATVLSGSWDQTVRLWDVESGRCLRTFTGHRALVTAVCLSGDGRWALSGSWDCTVRFWEVATGRCVRTFYGHTSLVTSVAMSARAHRAISGSWDCTVRLWDLPDEVQQVSGLRSSSVAAGTPADST